MWRCSVAIIFGVGMLISQTAHAWELAVKEVLVPLFVYSEEKNNVCINISNNDRWSARDATVVLTMKPKNGVEKRIERSFNVRNKRDDAVLIPFDMADFPERAGTIDVIVKEVEVEVFSGSIAVRDSFAGLDGIKTKLGRLVDDGEGIPQMICTVLEDPAKYRKWAPLKWVMTRSDTSPKKVLLLGSTMVDSPDRAQGPYVDALRKIVEKDEESFTFEARGGDLRPIFEDMLKVRDLVDKHKPGIFIFCPGLEDTYNSVPIRDFARALDVMIDQVRARETPPRIVLVTPVPMLSDLEFSEELADAVCDVAQRHHTDIVDLRKVLGRWERTLRKSYGEVDSNVFYRYPTSKAQERIAEAIARYVY